MVYHITDCNQSKTLHNNPVIDSGHPRSMSFRLPVIKAIISQQFVYIFITDFIKSTILYFKPSLSLPHSLSLSGINQQNKHGPSTTCMKSNKI